MRSVLWYYSAGSFLLILNSWMSDVRRLDQSQRVNRRRIPRKPHCYPTLWVILVCFIFKLSQGHPLWKQATPLGPSVSDIKCLRLDEGSVYLTTLLLANIVLLCRWQMNGLWLWWKGAIILTGQSKHSDMIWYGMVWWYYIYSLQLDVHSVAVVSKIVHIYKMLNYIHVEKQYTKQYKNT